MSARGQDANIPSQYIGERGRSIGQLVHDYAKTYDSTHINALLDSAITVFEDLRYDKGASIIENNHRFTEFKSRPRDRDTMLTLINFGLITYLRKTNDESLHQMADELEDAILNNQKNRL